MEPTLRPGDEVLVDRRPARPGDVVLIRHPFRSDVELVKRVLRLEAQGCFVVGDNPDPHQSTDSRSFGAVPLERLLGRVVWRLPR